MLFDHLPAFPIALPDEELAMLRSLPEWPTTVEVDPERNYLARRLERRGLIKIERYKTDPIALCPTWFAGKLPPAGLRLAHGQSGRRE